VDEKSPLVVRVTMVKSDGCEVCAARCKTHPNIAATKNQTRVAGLR
jgi:hypothetical protein